MKDPQLATYCDSIEREFFRLKGRPGMLSPADFALVGAWYRSGLRLSIVLEGIARAFAARRGGRDRGVEEVNSLASCEPFVQRLAKERPSF